MMTKTGLEEWSAPEMHGGVKYSEKIDLWSVGCVMYFMLSGQKPFDSKNQAKLFQLIQAGDIDLKPLDAKASESAIRLIKSLIEVNPEKRLSASQVLESSWLQKNQPAKDSTE